MSKVWVCADLHLGHKNITKFRTQFTTAEEHHKTVMKNFLTTVGKRDKVFLLYVRQPLDNSCVEGN